MIDDVDYYHIAKSIPLERYEPHSETMYLFTEKYEFHNMDIRLVLFNEDIQSPGNEIIAMNLHIFHGTSKIAKNIAYWDDSIWIAEAFYKHMIKSRSRINGVQYCPAESFGNRMSIYDLKKLFRIDEACHEIGLNWAIIYRDSSWKQ